MMTVHKMTIRALAHRMNITLKRVRQVRVEGLSSDLYCTDWSEAITGSGVYATHTTHRCTSIQ